jgi:echinoderm microtubule-associated protein-like 1/2
MGIWHKHSDGTDINAVHLSSDQKLVVTGDDRALVNIYNYPSVIKHAPSIALSGHGSHVMNVKFIHQNLIISIGGDGAIFFWSIQPQRT